jgi:uncharacterized protein
MTDWQQHLLDDDAGIAALVTRVRTVAVLGIKPESHQFAPAHFVPRYLVEQGLDVVPVPVYYPDVTEILGRPVYRKLAEIPRPIDLVNVFRRPRDIPPHLPDILEAKPKAVWFQSGIRHDDAARQLAEAGIQVVQDRCLMIELRRFAPPRMKDEG